MQYLFWGGRGVGEAGRFGGKLLTLKYPRQNPPSKLQDTLPIGLHVLLNQRENFIVRLTVTIWH